MSNETAIVLISGGLDSAVLLAEQARHGRALPVYVSVGLAWEAAERQMLMRLLASPVFATRVDPLEELEFNMRDVYRPTHWAIRGVPPAYDTPDEDVYLSGRNLVFLTKAGVVAADRKLSRITLGLLADNPFPDATPEFFDAMRRALTLGLGHPVEVRTPFTSMTKQEVIRLGESLHVPLELTLSCMNPVDGSGGLPLHCGRCSKCRERRDAFAASGVADKTAYANASPR